MMQELESLPEPLKHLQKCLHPYIKQRQEAARVRRVLAAHLNTRIGSDGQSVPRPLSLLDASCNVDEITRGVRGLQKEYLRCVRSNIDARREYAEITRTQKQHINQDVSQETVDAMEPFLSLTRQKQKHETLCIIQDYIEILGQKPAAAPDYLEPKEALKGVESPPQIPPEVMDASVSQNGSKGVDLNVLMDQLEKSVLRARLLLEREQKLLSKVRAEQGSTRGSRLQALGTARNELINWIETELSRAPSEEDEDEQVIPSPEKKYSKESTDAQIASIQRQYARYVEARQKLVTTTLASPPPHTSEPELEALPIDSDSVANTGINSTTYPYLSELLAISASQKSLIQQKSHLTITLSKQLKDAAQSLERLTHESHLLPAHPMPSQQKRLESLSFNEEISRHENPDSLREARAWVYASEAAANACKETILEKLEEGSAAIDETRQTLSELRELLGEDGDGQAKDVWSLIDGSLGVIKQPGGAVD